MTDIAPIEKSRPSDAQWEAIRETERHMLVSAGAGTGKTFTVVSHILYLMGVETRENIHSPALALEQIAAITFTNKAAAELKEKLRNGLRAAGRRAESYRVDNARVGTIHGFCGDILREFALRGSLAPGLALLDESESRARRAECVRDALLRALERAPGDPGSVDGLVALLAEYSVREVEGWTAELLEEGDHLRAIVEDALAHPPRERALISLAVRAESLFAAQLRDHGEMDFDRMITWTRDLIRDDTAVRDTLRRRIRVLIIDEFQDVDPVQREIAYLLADPEGGSPDTTRLMLVGDPKQSIYSFRKADVRGWKTVERDFRDNGWGIVVPIADSRRSVPAVLGFVDHAIGSLLDEPIGGSAVLRDFEVAYAPVNPVRARESAVAVEFLTVPAKEDGCAHKVEVIRESEARAVARRAVELHQDSGVKWSEMAVLLSGWGALETYEGALRSAEVPTYARRTEGFYEQREILDLIVALEAIRNANDDRALLGFLRSPFIGVTDETLLRIANRVASPIWPLLGDESLLSIPEEDERARVYTAVELITRLALLRDRVGTSALIEELLLDTAYLSHLALMGQPGMQAIANVRKFIRIAESTPDVSLGAFLDLIESARELKVKEGSARLFGESDDVLTITSIHSAKGLEWKVVFWCDLVREIRNRSSTMLVSGTRISLGVSDEDAEEPGDAAADDEAAADTVGEREAIAAALKDERSAETKRLWYVAATRARDRLIICLPAGNSKTSREDAIKREKNGEAQKRTFGSAADAMKLVFPAIGSAAHERYRAADGREYEATMKLVEAVNIDESVEQPQRAALDASVLTPLPMPIRVAAGRSRHSATELLSEERCARRHWYKYVAGVREPEIAVGERHGEMNAIKRGLIVHDVLERLRELEELDALLEDAVRRHDPGAPSAESAAGVHYREEIAAELHTALEQPDYRAVLDAPGAKRELGFLHILDAGTYIEGKIDLVAPGADGYRVVDVKTSQCDPDAAAFKAEQYAIQKAVYIAALEDIGGARVADFGFQFTAIATRIGGALTDESRAALSARLHATLRALDVEPPALAKSANDCRFCGYRAVRWCPGVPEIAITGLSER
ncbi:MAG: UvrD-helicase domain-containing protein [Gemmatimonadota bacterium]